MHAAGSLSLLVADPHRDGADSLAVLLGCHGHRTRAVYDAATAREAAAALRPDVAFVDVDCPWGPDLARHLAAGPGRRPLLVGLTTWMMAVTPGVVDVTLQKPCDETALLQLLDAVEPHADALPAGVTVPAAGEGHADRPDG